MRLDVAQQHRIDISVSRRNLLTLLHKLHTPASARTITMQCANPANSPQDPGLPVLVALHGEPNDEHYNGREPGPALMDASSAAQIAIDLLQQIEDTVEQSSFESSVLRKTIQNAEYVRDRLDRTARTAVIT